MSCESASFANHADRILLEPKALVTSFICSFAGHPYSAVVQAVMRMLPLRASELV